MKISVWNQYWEHKEIVALSSGQVYEGLLKHYKQSSKTFKLDRENFPSGLSFHRGNVLFSIFLVGSELKFKHYVDVNIQETEEGKTQIIWNINLKLCGFQVGENALIEECKEVVKNISTTTPSH